MSTNCVLQKQERQKGRSVLGNYKSQNSAPPVMRSASFPGSTCKRKREPATFYHMCNIKGRHDLITQEWTKLDAHTHVQAIFSYWLHTVVELIVSAINNLKTMGRGPPCFDFYVRSYTLLL